MLPPLNRFILLYSNNGTINRQQTTDMTLFLHVTTHKGQGLWLIIGVCRYKAFIFANVGTNNVDQFTAGNADNVIK
jgi:hypothetical protein